MGRSGNPALRAPKQAPPPKTGRCHYCGRKTPSVGANTRLRRFSHSVRWQPWPPLCELAARTRAVLRRG